MYSEFTKNHSCLDDDSCSSDFNAKMVRRITDNESMKRASLTKKMKIMKNFRQT